MDSELKTHSKNQDRIFNDEFSKTIEKQIKNNNKDKTSIRSNNELYKKVSTSPF